MTTTSAQSLEEILYSLPIASDELLSQRILQKRYDSKFILQHKQLPELFTNLQQHYAIVRSNSYPIARYHNQYFDSRDHLFLREHYRGRKPRFKIRIRHYLDRNLSFLESKKKIASGVTIKSKIDVPHLQNDLNGFDSFLEENSPIPPKSLVPSITTTFRRITILNISTKERATCDINIQFQYQEADKQLCNGVIVEIKQLHFQPRSPLLLALKRVGARKLSISKYCTAGFFLIPSVPMKLYRPTIHMMEKVLHD